MSRLISQLVLTSLLILISTTSPASAETPKPERRFARRRPGFRKLGTTIRESARRSTFPKRFASIAKPPH